MEVAKTRELRGKRGKRKVYACSNFKFILEQ